MGSVQTEMRRNVRGVFKQSNELANIPVWSSDITKPIVNDEYNRIDGDDNNNVLNGTTNDDEILGNGGDDTISGLAGDDFIDGGSGNDIIDGGAGDDIISGGGDFGGDDTITDFEGHNSLSGGLTSDASMPLSIDIKTLSFASAPMSIRIEVNGVDSTGYKAISNGTARPLDGSNSFLDDISDFNRYVGSNYADSISGSANSEIIEGGKGSDVISGGGGDDIIDPGDGTETLYATNVSRPDIVKTAGEIANSFDTAININTGVNGDFDTDFDPDVDDPLGISKSETNSLLIPHATVRAAGSGTIDVYKIDLSAGTVKFDLDHNLLDGTSGRAIGLTLTLRNAAGENLAHFPSDGNEAGLFQGEYDPGNVNDGPGEELVAVIHNAGTFYLTVSRSLAESTSPDIPIGSSYVLNISDRSASVTANGGTAQGYDLISGGTFGTIDGSDGTESYASDGSVLTDGADAGNDTVRFGAAKSGVTADLGSTDVQDTGGAGRVRMYAFDNAIGTAFDDTLTGTDGVNSLTGLDGDDHLILKGGDDIADGGAGNDTIEGGEGYDTIGGGAGADTLVGNTGDDVIDGGDGNDVIYGGKGSDRLSGGAGDDILDGGNLAETIPVAKPSVVKSADPHPMSNPVIIDTGPGGAFSLADDPNFSMPHQIPHATIDATVTPGRPDYESTGGTFKYDYYKIDGIAGERLTVDIGDTNSDGQPFGMVAIIADANGNYLGGAYTFADANSRQSPSVTAVLPTTGSYYIITHYASTDNSSANPLDHEVSVGATYKLNVSLTGAATDVIEGGYDVLDGGTGIDTASYATSPSGVTVDLNRDDVQATGGGGHDQLISIENLTGSKFADKLTGDGGPNALQGGYGDDTLEGGDGADTLSGNQDNDILYGNQGDDTLYGGQGRDTLDGGQGDDVLQGGLDADKLTGGSGADTFRYRFAADSSLSSSDEITDFQSGSDKIDLTAIHTNLADRFSITTVGANTFVDVDLGGDGSSDMRIQVDGANAVAATDIAWINPGIGGSAVRLTGDTALAGIRQEAGVHHLIV